MGYDYILSSDVLVDQEIHLSYHFIGQCHETGQCFVSPVKLPLYIECTFILIGSWTGITDDLYQEPSFGPYISLLIH